MGGAWFYSVCGIIGHYLKCFIIFTWNSKKYPLKLNQIQSRIEDNNNSVFLGEFPLKNKLCLDCDLSQSWRKATMMKLGWLYAKEIEIIVEES